MTEQEINKLALDYVMTQDYFTRSREMEDVARDVIKTILRDHCIVSQSEVIAKYNDDKAAYNMNKGDCDYFEGYWEGRIDVYERIFGSELFEERSEK